MKKMFMLLIFNTILGIICCVQAQNNGDTIQTSIHIQYRPRTELMQGYRSLHADTSQIAALTSHRFRLNITHEVKKFKLYTSLQNVHVWGNKHDQNISLFEAYVDYKLDEHFSLKAGRQRISIDNERLFSERNWVQTGESYDAFSLSFQNSLLKSQFIGSFNQNTLRYQGTSYYYNEQKTYKYLLVHYLLYKLNKSVSISLLNTIDGFEKLNGSEIFRYTNGGRISLHNEKLFFTVHGYHQHGFHPFGDKVKAWYISPELKVIPNKTLQLTVGSELMSGQNMNTNAIINRSFIPLYGVGHKFMGYMDYFVSFPNDINGLGLTNPYIMLAYNPNKNVTIHSDFHTFFTHFAPFYNNSYMKNYLGFEHDITLRYQCNSYTNLFLGFSYLLPTESLEMMRNIGNSKEIQHFSYFMLTVSPEILKYRKAL
jgi:hypothetical protein